MEKSKRTGKTNRRKWIMVISLALFGGCVLISFNIYSTITAEPYYDNELLRDIDNVYSDVLVEARLLEYVTIGESTHTEVQAFGDEQLADTHYPCHVTDNTSQTCYYISRPVFGCEYYLLQITFIFEDDILDAIEFENQAKCL
jgi:hypothetical protein